MALPPMAEAGVHSFGKQLVFLAGKAKLFDVETTLRRGFWKKPRFFKMMRSEIEYFQSETTKEQFYFDIAPATAEARPAYPRSNHRP